MTTTTSPARRVALLTGGSAGLGLALTDALVERGWTVVTDGRRTEPLAHLQHRHRTGVVGVEGDVTDPDHREHLAEAVEALGRLDLLVNNASTIGSSPMPALSGLSADEFRRVLDTNVVAPMALAQRVLGLLRSGHGTVVNLSSDAAVEAYEGWGAYGASKAALDHASAILAAEEPDIRVLSIDPGDMRTELHQAAFPGEDISDRPSAAAAVPGLLDLIELADSGRHRVEHAAGAA